MGASRAWGGVSDHGCCLWLCLVLSYIILVVLFCVGDRKETDVCSFFTRFLFGGAALTETLLDSRRHEKYLFALIVQLEGYETPGSLRYSEGTKVAQAGYDQRSNFTCFAWDKDPTWSR